MLIITPDVKAIIRYSEAVLDCIKPELRIHFDIAGFPLPAIFQAYDPAILDRRITTRFGAVPDIRLCKL
jgi:hypothetical protein